MQYLNKQLSYCQLWTTRVFNLSFISLLISFWIQQSITHNLHIISCHSDVLILFLLVSGSYDVYIVSAEDDQAFVDEIATVLERPPYCMKVCTDYRELSDTAVEAIATQYSKVLVVLSESFNRCPDADYMVNFALRLSPGLFKHECFSFQL